MDATKSLNRLSKEACDDLKKLALAVGMSVDSIAKKHGLDQNAVLATEIELLGKILNKMEDNK